MNTRPEKEYETVTEVPDEMSWEDIERESATEIDAAIKFQKENVIPNRTKNWDRYYGRPFGNEIKGRSKYMSKDLLETVEWILPNLIKLFTSSDYKVKLKIINDESVQQNQELPTQPLTSSQLGLALMGQIYKDLYTDESGGLFTVFYTWFKDALVSGSAYTKLFWETDTTLAKIDKVIDEFEFNKLSVMPEVSISQAKLHPSGQVSVEGTIERVSKDQLVCDGIPHWEFIFEEHTRSMNDDTGKGFATVVTLDFLRRINKAYSTDIGPYFHNLDLIEAIASNDYYDYETEQERKRYYDYEVLNEYVGAKSKGPKRRIQFTEWYTRLDVNGDGFLEDVKVWRANGVMVRWEINEANFIPCSKISPIFDCYKFQGIAYADLIVELQELKTMLIRKMLDNFDLQNAGRWFKRPNSPLDLKRFLQNVPGDVFSVNPDHIKNVAPQGFDTSQLSLLEYVEGIKENRTGSTRYNQGTDASTLNQTAHGIQTIMTASMKRIELIGTLFAEGGIKDFFKKAAILYQQNMEEPFQSQINGETVTIYPEMIQGHIEAYTDMGSEDQAGQIESQKLLQMSAVLFDLNSKFPGLISPEKAHNLAAKYVSCMGFESTNYLTSSAEFAEASKKSQQMQETLQQMQLMMEQAKLQIEREGVDIKKIAALGEIAAAQEELKAKLLIERAKLNEKEGDSFNKMRIDLFKEIYSHVASVHTNSTLLNKAPEQLSF